MSPFEYRLIEGGKRSIDLTRPFRDPDRALERIVEVLQVTNEFGRVDRIPMEGNKVNGAAPIARSKEIL